MDMRIRYGAEISAELEKGFPMTSRRQQLYSHLGPLPSLDLPLSADVERVEHYDDHAREYLTLHIADYASIPALLIRPKSPGPHPLVLYSHSHGDNYALGKSEAITACEYMLTPGYGLVLATYGIATLAIDHICFEERAELSEGEVFKTMLWQGKVMWGHMVYESLRALDYVCTRSDIDSSRIGALGMSMGSTMTQWVAALDERIKVSVDICCLTNYTQLLKNHHADLHGYYFFVPGLYNHYTVADINALIAPRPHLCLAGQYDPLTPEAGLHEDDLTLTKIYSEQGARERWKMEIYPVAHEETLGMRESAINFLLAYIM